MAGERWIQFKTNGLLFWPCRSPESRSKCAATRRASSIQPHLLDILLGRRAVAMSGRRPFVGGVQLLRDLPVRLEENLLHVPHKEAPATFRRPLRRPAAGS